MSRSEGGDEDDLGGEDEGRQPLDFAGGELELGPSDLAQPGDSNQGGGSPDRRRQGGRIERLGSWSDGRRLAVFPADPAVAARHLSGDRIAMNGAFLFPF